MSIVVIGYIKDFEVPKNLLEDNSDVKIIEGISERIDYIRANKLEQKESFTLVPKFVTNITETGKQIMIFIQKIDILSNKKRKILQFGRVQSSPFFDSRQILVTAQKLKDLFPIETLIINWGSIPDCISYLKSADSYIYGIKTILIHNKIFADELDQILNEYHFLKNDTQIYSDYVSFSNNKPDIKTAIFKTSEDVLEYFCGDFADIDYPDIVSINWNNNIGPLPFAKFFPCKDSVIYFSSKFYSERIKDLVIFGNTKTMIRLANVIKDKRIIFLESLKHDGFILNKF